MHICFQDFHLSFKIDIHQNRTVNIKVTFFINRFGYYYPIILPETLKELILQKEAETNIKENETRVITFFDLSLLYIRF